MMKLRRGFKWQKYTGMHLLELKDAYRYITNVMYYMKISSKIITLNV